MIITSTAHGRTSAATGRLARHLASTVGQTVRVVAANDVTQTDDFISCLEDVQRYKVLNRRSVVGLRHLSINPDAAWTDRHAMIASSVILRTLGAQQSPWILIRHEKPRAGGTAYPHFHLVVGQYGSDGKAVNAKGDYVRLEAVARQLEVSFGEPMTLGRRPLRVAAELDRLGRGDIADAVRAAAEKSELPRSAMTTRSRAAADRAGVHLPTLRVDVARAWATADPLSILRERGMSIMPGFKDGVWVVVTADGVVVGAVDRLVHEPREATAARVADLMAKRSTDYGNKPGGDADDRTRAGAEGRDPQCASVGDRHAIDGGRNPRDSTVGGGRGVDRHPRSSGSENRYRPGSYAPDGATRNADRPSQIRTLIAARQAEAARRRGRRFDAPSYKAALWRQIFAVDLDCDLVALLRFIDVANRYVWTADGWIRDAGDVLHASSSDPVVVRLLVAAVIAKGWTAVVLYGDAAFIREAGRQLDEAGISWTVEGTGTASTPPAPPAAPIAVPDQKLPSGTTPANENVPFASKEEGRLGILRRDRNRILEEIGSISSNIYSEQENVETGWIWKRRAARRRIRNLESRHEELKNLLADANSEIVDVEILIARSEAALLSRRPRRPAADDAKVPKPEAPVLEFVEADYDPDPEAGIFRP